MLIEVISDLVANYTGACLRWDGLQGPHRAVELLGGPGQGGLAPGGDVLGALRAGQVADRGLLEERGGQRAGVAEPGGVHRRGDDRLAVGVTAGPGIAAQQVRDPGQVLGDLPVLPGGRGGRGRFGQHRVTGAGRGVQVGGGEPVRDVDDPAAGRIDPGRVAAGELGQPLKQPPGRPGRISGAGPGARRSGIGVPLLGPHGGDDHVAFPVEQVGQAAQHRRAAVSVGVLAQLTQPQHRAGRDPGLQPRRQRGGIQRVVQPPVRKPVGDRLVGGAGLARRRSAADHHQPTGGHRRVQDGPQQLIVRPADIRRHRPAADHLVHAQLHRIPLGRRAARGRLFHGGGFWRADHAGHRQPGQVQGRQRAQDRHHYRRPR